MGCHCLLQGIFPTEGSKPAFRVAREVLYLPSEPPGSPSPVGPHRIPNRARCYTAASCRLAGLHMAVRVSSPLAWIVPGTEPAVRGVAKSRARLSDFPFPFPFHALQTAVAAHSRVLAWRIPGPAEPGGLPALGPRRVRSDWRHFAAAAVSVCRCDSNSSSALS